MISRLLVVATLCILLCSVVLVTTTAVVRTAWAFPHISRESAAYNAGFWKGVSGIELKGRHTPEFIAGYINGSQNYENNRGYVDGNNKVSESSHNADYIQGYNEATVQDRDLFGGLDKVVVGHDPHDFYLGMYKGQRPYFPAVSHVQINSTC